ncbi:MAG: alanine--tRNA ligase [Saprospiraceae bacterium]|nr:alanine--tRNA ligase [Saprospiraceae bacterium]
MKAKQIRQQFFDFFQSKEHKIVSSAPIVNHGDPSLLFINAGMNPFKDFFLGNKVAKDSRIADTQKCLRVSGKHNDLEEVGVDSYHHTMFEMLGNWSFGDYFKIEAIAWAWELLTSVYGIDQDRLYVTIFEGDQADGLAADAEAVEEWSKWIGKARILPFGKKDNFWEMGDTGPCGPCSEIHIDLRSQEDRVATPAKDLINQDHPLVVEIWNLVFIQYDRKANGSLSPLPAKHIDTGMGFERLCMALQGKQSNYDTDLFTPYLAFLEEHTGITYSGSYDQDAKADMAMRVVADHVRAVCFTVADGVLPSNTGAGYVIRRILRRAVRYYYSFLNTKQPLLHLLVPLVAESFRDIFPEIGQQEAFISKVVLEEEKSFLHTLAAGLKRLDQLNPTNNVIDGAQAFELYDTFGFPIDLTRLIAQEKGWQIDQQGFEQALSQQRNRSKADAQKEVGDWVEITPKTEFDFVGYDQLMIQDAHIVKYRTIRIKNKDQYQLVLDRSPFYAEGGGQIGDTGNILIDDEVIEVLDTVKENDLFIHIVDKLPKQVEGKVRAQVAADRRAAIENNHSATHLLHAALRSVLGSHVSQKGSLVSDKHLRFDFSHFQKLTPQELSNIEQIVNKKIRANIDMQEARSIPLVEAEQAGAMMLFGEKYGEKVRMITFDPDFSRELCGGCHVAATGNIGFFKVVGESAIAAGVRRIEALTGQAAEQYISDQLAELSSIKKLLKSPTSPAAQVSSLQQECKQLQKALEKSQQEQVGGMKDGLKQKFEEVDGINVLISKIEGADSKALKQLGYQLEKEVGNAFIVFGSQSSGKAQLMVIISEALTKSRQLHAGNIVKSLAKEIKGGGGGQPFFATAGGKDATGLDRALAQAKDHLTSM